MTSKIVVNNIESDTGIATITISSPVNLSGGTTGGVTVGTGASISSPTTNVLTISTNNSERIRVDSAGYIGIGTDNPQKLIDISGSATGITTTGRLQIHPHANGFDIVSTAGDIAPHYQSLFALYTGQSGSGTLRWRVDSSGRVTMPYQPAFSIAKTDNDGQIGAGVYVFNQVHLNRGGHYSTSTGRFTAPVAGAYYFIASLQLYGAGAAYCRFQKNGSDLFTNGNSGPVYEDGPDVHETVTFGAVIDLGVNDYVTVERNATTRGMQSSFSGYLIG